MNCLPVFSFAEDVGFTDVKEGSWYYNSVMHAKENDIMDGVSNSEFASKDAMTRASFVTVLWAIAGKPNDTLSAGFSDVPENAWYADTRQQYALGTSQCIPLGDSRGT